MRYIAGILLSSYSSVLLAQEDVPQVGKHVATNLDVVSILLSLFLVLALVVASAFVLKKFQPQGTKQSGLKLITSLHLGAKEKLVVVEVDNKQLLLGVTAQQVNLIQTLETPIEVGHPLSMELGQNIVKLLKNNEK